MSKILAENKVTDECKEFYKLGIDEDQFLPAIYLYFNDELIEA